MILIQIKKNNSIFFLILFIFTIISSKTFASNKDLPDKNILINQLKLSNNRLITKTDTKDWIKALNNDLNLLEKTIIINKDYLKLIKQFPSDKNIKSFDINQDLKKYKNELYGFLESINALKKLYKLLNSDENFEIYLVRYDFNFEKSSNEKFIWLSLCIPNSNYDNEFKKLREISLKTLLSNGRHAFYFLGKSFYYPTQQNLISFSKSLGISESKLHKFVCKKFNEKQLKIY